MSPVSKGPFADDINQVGFWLRLLSQGEEIIMDKTKIRYFNADFQKEHPRFACALASYQNEIYGEDIRSLIEKQLPPGPLYSLGQLLTKSFCNDLHKEMNIKDIRKSAKVQFAYTIRGTALRLFPSNMFVVNDPSDYEFDLFQESILDPAEPLVVLHASKSGQWCFVQTVSCRGWVRKEDIAVARARKVWQDYLESAHFLVVTGNRLHLSCTPYHLAAPCLEFTMGSRLPLVDQDRVPGVVENQSSVGSYVVKLPKRGSEGELSFRLALVPCVGAVSVGYLDYCSAAVLKQAFKMQGERYGWGGLFKGRDCSGFVKDIYRCFGFQFPRNSGEQMLLPGQKISFHGAGRLERMRLLDQLPSGALLFFPGHVMLYLGKGGDEHYVIHAIAYCGDRCNRGEDSSIVSVPLNTVTVSPLSLVRRNGEELLMALTSALLI